MVSVLYLPTRYFPSISGAEFYFQRIAEILTKKFEFNIDIFTSNAIDFSALHSSKGKIIKKSEKFFSRVNHLKINRFPIEYDFSLQKKVDFITSFKKYQNLNISYKSLKKFLLNGPFVPKLINYLMENKKGYDLIHTTYFPYLNLIITLILGEKFGIPTLCTPFFHFTNPRYLETDSRKILSKFDILIACTHSEKEFLKKNIQIDEKKIKIIPMGVDYDKFRNFEKNVSFRQKFFKQGEKKYKMVLFCGYKNYEKGALSILKSIPYIIENYKKIYFVFIGPPTQAFNRELSKVRKSNEVRIINLTPDNLTGYFDKYKLSAFKESDIYLMPSRSDAFGIAYLEAWASGKPVIGANIGATPEVINDNKDGLLVKFDDPLDIKVKVLKLLKHNKLRKSMGKIGQMKVKNNYTWNIVADRTHQLYLKIINS